MKENQHLIIIEPDPELFIQAISLKDFSHIFKDKRVSLLIGLKIGELVMKLNKISLLTRVNNVYKHRYSQ